MEDRQLIYVLLILGGIIFSYFIAGTKLKIYALCFYVAVLVVFENQSGWGMLITDLSQVDNIYNKGTGQLFFSLVNIFLFYLVGALLVQKASAKNPIQHNLKLVGYVFVTLFLLNHLYGMLADIGFEEIYSYKGTLNLLNFTFFFAVIVGFVSNERDYRLMVNVVVVLAVVRGLWGIFRYIFLGGDPSNFYANNQGLDVKLTFFDINDSLVATMVAFIAGWRFYELDKTKLAKKIAYGCVAITELMIVILSYRRTAWIGLLMAYCLFLVCQQLEVRRKLLLGGLAFVIPLMAYALMKRSDVSGGEFGLATFFPDIYRDGQLSFDTGRFAELYAVWIAIEDDMLFGRGSWGVYDGSSFAELDFHIGDFSWMHSGVFHVALKMGLIGVALSFATFVLFFKNALSIYSSGDKKNWDVLMAGVAGVLFMLPNWLFGTPVIEYRTMQLMAFSFALPYVAYAMARRNAG